MDSPVILPDEVLSIISLHLGYQEDFTTLFSCALASRSIADSSLRVLYQSHEHSYAFLQLDDLPLTANSQDSWFKKWLVLWRSIISSALNPCPTYKPYFRYIRILDFRNLLDMMESTRFSRMKRSLYASPLSEFQHQKADGKVVDLVATINHVGETVLMRGASSVEELAGLLRPGYLARWVTTLPRLQSLTLWHGDALDKECGEVIAKHCEHFKDLTVKDWVVDDADESFASFLNALPEDTIQNVKFISRSSIHRKSFEALSRHGKSLKRLELDLCAEAVMSLDALEGCTELEILALEDSTRTVMVQSEEQDSFEKTVAWLRSCSHLREIRIKGLVDAPSLVGQAAYSWAQNLKDLRVEGYNVNGAGGFEFHLCLEALRELETLHLKANADDAAYGVMSTLQASLRTLTNLKDLSLIDVSDPFEDDDLVNIVSCLIQLERLCISGQSVSDSFLALLSDLRNLKSVTLLALAQLSRDQITQMIHHLDISRQQGFYFSIQAGDPDYPLSDDEVNSLDQLMRERVGGRFDYVLWRDAEWSESDDE